MPFDQYFVEINGDTFSRRARRVANDTEDALPYVILGNDISAEFLWGNSVKLGDELFPDGLQCAAAAAPFYIASNINDLTIIGGTYIACDPHGSLKHMAVVNELGKPSLFSLFSHITQIDVQGGEFTAIYADDPKAFASGIEAQYSGQEHNFAIFQHITALVIIGGTFISVRSTDLTNAFPSSITATPDFHLFRHMTSIDIIGATFTAVLPPSMRKDIEQGRFPHIFFEHITSVTCVSSRFFFITLQEYIQRWKRSGPGIINTDSNNKTKLLMKNVGNGDINFHIYDGVVSFKEPSLSQPKRDAPFGQQPSEVSSEKSRKMKAAISGLLAIIHDVPTSSSSAGGSEIPDEIRESKSESSPIPRPRLEDQDRGTSQKAVKRTGEGGAGAIRAEPLQHPAVHVSTPTDTNQPNHTTEEPHFIPKEHLITIHPLVLPPDGNPTVAALQLASLYFAAALHPADIPDFEAEYIYHDGACASILLILESAYDAEHLKKAWDKARHEALRVTSLVDVILYRGNVTTKILAQSDRDAALNALASYTINKPALGSPSL